MITFPTISVVIPVYNSAEYLVECLSSIANQTFQNFECILVNDGSTDNSGIICDSFADTDSRFSVLHTCNNGRTMARYNGVMAAKGDFVCFVDSDDSLPHDALSVLRAAASDDTDIVIGAYDSRYVFSNDRISVVELIDRLMHFENGLTGPVGKLYRRNLLNDYVFDIPRNIYFGEDVLLNIRAAFRTHKPVQFIDGLVYNYVLRDTGTCKNFNPTAEYVENYYNELIRSIPEGKYLKYQAHVVAHAVTSWLEATNDCPIIPSKSCAFWKTLRELFKETPCKLTLYSSVMFRMKSFAVRCLLIRLKDFFGRMGKVNNRHCNQKKKAIVYGYTMANLGDDLMIKSLCDRFPDVKFIVLCHPIARGLGGICKNIKLFYITSLFVRIINKLGQWFGFCNLFERILSRFCDASVCIAGSYFMQRECNWNYQYMQMRQRVASKTPLFIIGSNFGPYKDPIYLSSFEEIFRASYHVTFREEKSARLFQHLPNISYAPDVVLSLSLKLTTRVIDEKYVAISVLDLSCRDELISKYEVYEASLVYAIDKLIGEGFSVCLMSFCQAEGDDCAIQRIYEKLNSNNRQNVHLFFYDGTNLQDAINLIGYASYMIATRFHAMILGWLLNVRTLPIVYSDKMINVINDYGYEGPFVDLFNLSDPASIDEKLSFCDYYFPVVTLKQEATNHFNAIKKFLT